MLIVCRATRLKTSFLGDPESDPPSHSSSLPSHSLVGKLPTHILECIVVCDPNAKAMESPHFLLTAEHLLATWALALHLEQTCK